MYYISAFFCTLVAVAFAGIPCLDDKLICSDNAKCTFDSVKFACECNAGYKGDGVTCTDIDECLTQADSCDNNAYCHNINGSFHCHCNGGFSGNGVSCTDIDECVTMSPCDKDATCANLPGSYSCTCGVGFTGDGTSCDCASGFLAQGDNCVDVDECLGSPCAGNAICTNTAGGYECKCGTNFAGDAYGTMDCECATGFTKQGSTCVDVDECTKAVCHKNAVCTNTEGSFTCACLPGFTGTGLNCSVFDFCDTCTDAEQCVTISAGRKVCECKPGYTRDPGTQDCVDIDECVDLATHGIQCSRNGYCNNVKGSFECLCKKGYHGDGLDCLSVDQFCKDGVIG